MAQGSAKDEMLDKLDPMSIKALQRCFHSYDCFPLPRPVADDKDLAKLDTLEFRALSESFKEEYAIFERSMFSSLKEPFNIPGTSTTMTGPTLADLFVKYVVPVVPSFGFCFVSAPLSLVVIFVSNCTLHVLTGTGTPPR